jgi:hypothetical protein
MVSAIDMFAQWLYAPRPFCGGVRSIILQKGFSISLLAHANAANLSTRLK